MNDLTPGEAKVTSAVGDFLDVIETTPMTKSFKMLTLLAMLNRNELPGKIHIRDLTQEFRRVARRSETLRHDVCLALEHETELQNLVVNNPVEAWAGGKGTGDTVYFKWDGEYFRSDFTVLDELYGDFQNLLRELVDWRLAEYLDRGQGTNPNRFTCRVLQAQGRPIIKLPNRTNTPHVPAGWINIVANDEPFVANFGKEFITQTEQNSKR